MKIFLSSTCYDLADARSVLERFFASRGHVMLLSDRPSFPVAPNLHRHDMCVSAVGDAELFLLIVDRRRGAPYHSDQSISVTQAEFRAAKANNIPTLAYVRRAVFDERATWKKNPGLTPAHAEEVGVFEFISEIQSHPSGIWICAFDSVTNILDSLEAMTWQGEGLTALPSASANATVLPAFSGPAQRYLRPFLNEKEPNVVDADVLSRALAMLPPSGLVMIPTGFEEEHTSEFVTVTPVRPADSEGDSWYCARQLTPLGAMVRHELDRVLDRFVAARSAGSN